MSLFKAEALLLCVDLLKDQVYLFLYHTICVMLSAFLVWATRYCDMLFITYRGPQDVSHYNVCELNYNLQVLVKILKTAGTC